VKEIAFGGVKMKNVKVKPTELDNQIRDEDHAWFAIEDEIIGKEIDEEPEPDIHDLYCEHTPDILDPTDMDIDYDKIIIINECKCGKTVKEYFTHSHTNVSD